MKLLIDLYLAWFRMGLFTFGGGYAMLPMIEKEVIEKYHWATEEEIMNYFAIGQCTPGVIAVNTATFVGFKLKGVLGAIFATLGVVSPSLVIIMLIAQVISNFNELIIVQRALSGIRVGVCCLMIMSIIKLFKNNIKDMTTLIICICVLLICLFTNISSIILVIISGIVGIVYKGWSDNK